MKQFFLYISLVLLLSFIGCSKDDTSDIDKDTEIVYIDESLKDNIGKTINAIAGICEVRYVDASDSAVIEAVIEEVRRNPSSAVITRDFNTEPKGLMTVCRGSLPSDVFVTMASTLDGLFLSGGFAAGFKPDDAALGLIEKARSRCSTSAVEKLDRTFENVCLSAINVIQMHSMVSVQTYESQNVRLKKYCKQVFTFPASSELDIVMYVNESCPYKLVSMLEVEFVSSGEFLSSHDFSIPPFSDADVPLYQLNGDGNQYNDFTAVDKNGVIVVTGK